MICKKHNETKANLQCICKNKVIVRELLKFAWYCFKSQGLSNLFQLLTLILMLPFDFLGVEIPLSMFQEESITESK